MNSRELFEAAKQVRSMVEHYRKQSAVFTGLLAEFYEVADQFDICLDADLFEKVESIEQSSRNLKIMLRIGDKLAEVASDCWAEENALQAVVERFFSTGKVFDRDLRLAKAGFNSILSHISSCD